MPRRLDLDLSEEVYEALEALRKRTGRPIRDLVEDFIAQSVTPGPTESRLIPSLRR